MATTVELTGGAFQDVAGNVLALGTLVLNLSQDGQVNSDAQLGAGHEITINLDSNGNVSTSPAQSVWPNDVITPANTFYNVSAYTANGQLVWGPNAQQILSAPSPFDIGAWIPAEVNVGSVTSGLYVELDPSAGQVISLNTNGPNYLEISNNNAGGGAVSALYLTNGTDAATIGLAGTGSSVPGALVIANTRMGAELVIGANNAPIVISGSGFTVNAPINYSTDTGTANNYILNVPSSFSSPVAGQQATFLAANSSTGASTLVWALSGSPLALVKNGSTALTTGDILAGTPYTVFYNGTVWELMNSSLVGGSASVTSVFSRTGAVVAASGDYTVSQVTGAAPTASPTFTGVPAAPTAAPGTNTTQLATTAFVAAAASAAPFQSLTTTGSSGAATLSGGVLNIPNYAGGVTSVFGRTGAVVASSADYTVSQVTGAAPIASPTFTGTPAAPTASSGTNTTQVATTAFVQTAVGSYLPLVAGTGNVITGEIFEVNPASSGTVTLLDISNSAGNWAGLQVQSVSNVVSFTAKNSFQGYSSFMTVNPSTKPALIPDGGSVYMYGLGFGFASGVPSASVVGGFFQASASTVLNLSASSAGTAAMTLNVIGTVNSSLGFATGQSATASTTASDHSIPIVVNGTTYYMRLSATP